MRRLVDTHWRIDSDRSIEREGERERETKRRSCWALSLSRWIDKIPDVVGRGPSTSSDSPLLRIVISLRRPKIDTLINSRASVKLPGRDLPSLGNHGDTRGSEKESQVTSRRQSDFAAWEIRTRKLFFCWYNRKLIYLTLSLSLQCGSSRSQHRNSSSSRRRRWHPATPFNIYFWPPLLFFFLPWNNKCFCTPTTSTTFIPITSDTSLSLPNRLKVVKPIKLRKKIHYLYFGRRSCLGGRSPGALVRTLQTFCANRFRPSNEGFVPQTFWWRPGPAGLSSCKYNRHPSPVCSTHRQCKQNSVFEKVFAPERAGGYVDSKIVFSVCWFKTQISCCSIFPPPPPPIDRRAIWQLPHNIYIYI